MNHTGISKSEITGFILLRNFIYYNLHFKILLTFIFIFWPVQKEFY